MFEINEAVAQKVIDNPTALSGFRKINRMIIDRATLGYRCVMVNLEDQTIIGDAHEPTWFDTMDAIEDLLLDLGYNVNYDSGLGYYGWIVDWQKR